MINMNSALINSFYRQGASHKPQGIPCQDHARDFKDDKIGILALSDGHGGKKYFRSQYGSEIAVNIAEETLKEFCRDFDFQKYFSGDNPPEINLGIQDEVDVKFNDLEFVMRHVFVHICSRWHREIERHWNENPLKEDERTYLYKEQNNSVSLYEYYFDKEDKVITKNLPSAYGCTLFGVAETIDGYWIAFQIGDGKCIAFREDGSWYEPIPWDNRCYQNLTTSLSHYGEESFRYAIGKGIPPAIFIASDGMDDSFAPESELAFEYAIRFLSNILLRDPDSIKVGFEKMLDDISTNLSRDDMSMGYMVWKERATSALYNYCQTQLPKFNDKLEKARSSQKEKQKRYKEMQATLSVKQSEMEASRTFIDTSIQEGAEKEAKLTSLVQEREKKDQSTKKFLSRRKDLLSLFKPNKKTEEEQWLENELESLANQIESNKTVIEKTERELRQMERELPVAKKHASESEKEVIYIQRKLDRLSKVKTALESYMSRGKEQQ